MTLPGSRFLPYHKRGLVCCYVSIGACKSYNLVVMAMKSDRPCESSAPEGSRNQSTALCIWLALLIPSCALPLEFKDVEYDKKLALARTDCRGDEIVGIWLTKCHWFGDARAWRNTTLFRPDGTGVGRAFNTTKDPTGTECRLQWSYSGNGVWHVTSLIEKSDTWWATMQSDSQGVMRYTGSELLRDERWSVVTGVVNSQLRQRSVSVRADDEAAVDAYLSKR